MTDKRDGLVIRRKVDKDAAEGAEEAAKAAAEAAEVAATTAEADARAKAERERAEAATAEAAARAKAERERAEAQRVAKGSAASAVEGRVWRDERSAPRVPEAAPKQAAAPERPREMPTVDDFAAMLGDAPMAERTVEWGTASARPWCRSVRRTSSWPSVASRRA
jgi:membrane protein involved in colicin uptake